ncbi:MAG: hypothetical protein JZU64_00525 [Rhodoferax sp.]|nr:hypothetical protein [Rhodoferax sp.]
MTTSFNTATASLAQMVAYFNTISPTPVKKFSDRKSAIARIEALEAKLAPAADKVEEAQSSVHAFEVHGLTNCPSCGCHLSNGIGEHLQEVNGKKIKHDQFEFACLGCGEEFGAPIPVKASKKAPTGKGTPKVKGVWLKPEICATPAQVEATAHDGVRRRPVTATTELGAVVVCSARTARKHGWVITGKLYGTTKATPAPAPTKASKAPAKPAKATTKATVKRAARLETLEDLLG